MYPPERKGRVLAYASSLVDRLGIGSERYRPLQAGEDRVLIERYRAGDRVAGDELVNRCTRFAVGIGLRYGCPPLDPDEAVQESLVALLDARRRYDPDRGPFVSCAGWAVRGRLEAAVKEMRGRPSTVSMNGAVNEGEELELGDTLPGDRTLTPEIVGACVDACTILRPFTSREVRILTLRHAHGLTLEEIASDVGISRQGVEQIERRTMDRARKRVRSPLA